MKSWLRPAGAVVAAVLVVMTAMRAPTRARANQGPVPSTRGNGWIAFVSDRGALQNQNIYRMLPDGTRQDRLTDDVAEDSQPAWSPDGSMIAFTSTRSGGGDVYVMTKAGELETRLTDSPALDSSPTWSPDGSRIAFTSRRNGKSDIYVMDADGSNPVNLTTNPASDYQPAWSPDGTRIAFVSDRSGNRDVFLMDADGSNPVSLTADPASDTEPAWSPNAAFLAFISDRSGNPDVFAVRADGADARDLTPDLALQSEPTFSPDRGTRVAFTTQSHRENVIGMVNVALDTRVSYGRVAVTHLGDRASDSSWQPILAGPPSGSPIQHVVVIFMENHSFDNVLGKLCVVEDRCDGTLTGVLADGSTIDLPPAANHVPQTYHSYSVQQAEINGGAMNGFSEIPLCTKAEGYACFQQFDPSQIPNLSAMARSFVISDATFEEDTVGSWGAHLGLASANLDGFYTAVPRDNDGSGGRGWGCDSFWQGDWSPTPTDPTQLEPMCVPFPDGTGAYRSTHVPWVPTIMNRMDGAGLTWGIWAPLADQQQYGWAICPSFADCVYTSQADNLHKPGEFAGVARAGHLPNLSLVVPTSPNSQHGRFSMIKGDNWIQSRVSAIMEGPDWASTAIFITYDDCGCFYDHVPPPENLGIRVPMVIVSQFAKPGFTDSNAASFASMLAFTEHTFGLTPLSVDDAEAYDYLDSFDFSQAPLPPLALQPTPLSKAERAWIRHHLEAEPGDFT